MREPIHCANCSLASSGQKIGWICTHKSLGDQWLQFVLASIFPLRWVVCYVFTDRELYIINILNQSFYLATFFWFYLSSVIFNTFNTICTCATFQCWQRPERQHLSRRLCAIILDNSWAENANLRYMLNWNLFSNYSIARCRLNLVKKCITDHWWLDQTVKKLRVRSIGKSGFRFSRSKSRYSPPRNPSSGWISIKKSKSGFHGFPFYRSIGKSEKGFAKLF